MKPIPGTEFDIDCDTLLLSVGLIPENELSRGLGWLCIRSPMVLSSTSIVKRVSLASSQPVTSSMSMTGRLRIGRS